MLLSLEAVFLSILPLTVLLSHTHTHPHTDSSLLCCSSILNLPFTDILAGGFVPSEILPLPCRWPLPQQARMAQLRGQGEAVALSTATPFQEQGDTWDGHQGLHGASPASLWLC